ncbi:TOM (translocase of outer membrane) complex component [Actinomortierella ambigua]|uniref:TOM (Translocase of outer membrane) complex component n=1 Tax=Actinomortierella ambigua TaxID=1343610 RepID=A0A9P6U343_9FUNG|nr:TOM (translocase of outer membrane) complex component [Actinomortierella ambigua]
MSTSNTLPATVPAPVPVSSTSSSSSGSNSLQKFLQDKDWKFYAAVASVTVLAGAGIYYLTSSSSSSSSSSAPETTKSKSKKKKKSNKKKSAAQKDAAASEGAAADSDSSVPKEGADDDVETMSAATIAKLSDKKRAEHAYTLKTRGNSQYAAKKWEEAIRLYSQAIAFTPDPVYYSNRAACYAIVGQFDKVIDDSTAALKLNPTYVKALGRRAHAYENTGKTQEALNDYTALCILDGFKNESFAQSMERTLKKLSDTKAKAILATREERLPSVTFISAYLDSFRKTAVPEVEAPNDEDGDHQFERAEYFISKRMYSEAFQAYQKAIELNTTHMAKALNMRGTFVFLMGDGKKALEDFNKSIEIDPTYVQTFIKRGSIYMEQGDAAKTFEEFDNAIKVNEKDPNIYYHRAQVYFITGEYELAIKDYLQSMELEPDFVFSHIQYGVAKYKLGEIEEAMNIFQKAMKDFPESGEVNNYYGELLLDQQKFSEAFERFDRAIKLSPVNPLPYINKALLVFQWKQDPTGAEKLCQQSLEADAECDVAIATLGQLYLQQGKLEKAIEYFDRSIALARTEQELTSALGFREAALAQVTFAQDYPTHAKNLGR